MRLPRFALLLVLLTSAAGCARPAPAPPPVSLTIATGGPGGAFYPVGTALAALYNQQLDGVETTIITGGSTENIQSVHTGQATVGFTQADVAYVAYRRGIEAEPQAFDELRGVAMLWMNTLHLVVPRTSAIQSAADLAGRRIAVGTLGSGTETLARIVLESYGLPYTGVRPGFLSFVETTEQMRRGELDAAIVVAGLPAEAITQLTDAPGVRLLPIPRAQVTAMRALYPFLQPMTVPAGTYRGIDVDVDTVGVSSLLVSREDVDEELVYRLTRALFDGLPDLYEAHPAVRLIHPDQAPATPIPLHPGAARYFRERQITR